MYIYFPSSLPPFLPSRSAARQVLSTGLAKAARAYRKSPHAEVALRVEARGEAAYQACDPARAAPAPSLPTTIPAASQPPPRSTLTCGGLVLARAFGLAAAADYVRARVWSSLSVPARRSIRPPWSLCYHWPQVGDRAHSCDEGESCLVHVEIVDGRPFKGLLSLAAGRGPSAVREAGRAGGRCRGG